AEIGKGEGGGEHGQRERAGDRGAAQRTPRTRLHEHDRREHEGARGESERREARRVELPRAEGEPREQRVRCESDEREERQRDRSRAYPPGASHSTSRASTRTRRSIPS